MPLPDFRSLVAERLAPPKRVKPSEWAQSFRKLSKAESAEAGDWHNERTPYLADVMDVAVEPGVQEIVFVKPTQVGASEAARNLLGYWIDNDPDPVMLVMPTEDAAKEQIKERIRPMLENTPALARHVSPSKEDNTTSCINLATMPIYFGWSNSPQSLATRPCRRVLFDEVDKYPPFSGREADPISLGTERTATYLHRKLVIKWSTPTTEDGPIWQAYLACGDKRHCVVPCPFCGRYQRLHFGQIKGFRDVTGNKAERARIIKVEQPAFYECERCQEQILDWQKPKMLLRRRWPSEGQTVDDDGNLGGLRLASPSVGLHMPSLYSPWRSWSDIAAEFVLAEGDAGKTQNFRNSWLAEPYRTVLAQPRASVIREKANTAPPPLIVPKWAQVLVATVDTQKNYFALAIRAWGWGYKSQLVYHGEVSGFEDVYRQGLLSQFSLEGSDRLVSPQCLLIDTGGTESRTQEVYDFVRRDPARIIPTKGQPAMRNPKPWWVSQLPNGVMLRNVNVDYFKDVLTRLIGDDDVTLWLPHKAVSDAYCMEMASEHKVADRKNPAKVTWQLKHQGARNEAWDLEVLQCAAAEMAGLGAAPKEMQEVPEPQVANPLTNWRGRW